MASCENTPAYVSEAGEVVASYAYDVFGSTLSATGPMADAFPFRFSTKYYDSETGLYYYGRRYYSPDLGRWITRDPIGEEGGVNLYAFCGNNGVGRIDPFGEDWNVMRRNLSFAIASRDNLARDTIYNLSLLVDLDPMEAMFWARKDKNGMKFAGRDELNSACRVYIPNRISLVLPNVQGLSYGQAFIPIVGYVMAGRMQQMIFMRDRLREVADMYSKRGFSIETLDYWIEDDSSIITAKDKNNRQWPTFGFIIGGHGWAGSIHVAQSADGNFESIGISKTKRGYSLGMLYVFGCFAGTGDWWSQAAPNAYKFVSPAWRPTIRKEMPTPTLPEK